MRKVTHTEVYSFATSIVQQLKEHFPDQAELTCFPVPRGGIPAAYALGECGRSMGVLINPTDNVSEADFILDDLIDSGATQNRYAEGHPEKPFFALINKPFYRAHCTSADKHEFDDWIVFPWEATEEGSASDIPTRLLQFVGEDPTRGGLLETPKRFLKAWQFYTSGYGKEPACIMKSFEDGAENCDEIVLVKDIPIFSHCEHHLAPFYGVAHIGYIPDGRVLGLSKFARLADIFMRRLQVQERLTNQIADTFMEELKPKGVGVVINCAHTCMIGRGVQIQGSTTITSAMRGVFREDAMARAELMALIK